MKHTKKIAGALASLQLISGAGAFADAMPGLFNYNYHAQSNMTLGKGFDPLYPDVDKRLCYSFEAHPAEEGALETSLDAYAVSNTRDLTIALGMDHKVDGKFLMFSGGGQFVLDTNFRFTKNSVSLVLVAKSEFGRRMLKNEQLYPQYAELLKEGSYNEFIEYCGSRLVTTEFRGASVSVVITLENVADEQKVRIVTDAHGSGQIGPIGGEAKSHFEALYHQKASSKEVRYKIFARGGTGLKSLDLTVASMIGNGETIDKIAEGLRKFVGEFDEKHAVPIRFATMPIHEKLKFSHINLLSQLKEEALSSLVWAWRDARSVHLITKKFLKVGWDWRREWFTDSYLQDAGRELEPLDAYIRKVASVHSTCLKAEISQLEQCELPKRPFTPRLDHIAGMLD